MADFARRIVTLRLERRLKRERNNRWFTGPHSPRHRNPPDMSLAIKMVVFIAALALVVAAALVTNCVDANAGTLRLQWCVPCWEADSARCDTLSAIRERRLAAQVVWAYRFNHGDSLYLGEIPEIGLECSADSADFEFDPGTVGVLIMRSRTLNGKLSCRYTSYVFAMPWDGVRR